MVDTGLKTGWVRCRHGAGRCGVMWGEVVTYLVDRTGIMAHMFLLSPENSVKSVSVFILSFLQLCSPNFMHVWNLL